MLSETKSRAKDIFYEPTLRLKKIIAADNVII